MHRVCEVKGFEGSRSNMFELRRLMDLLSRRARRDVHHHGWSCLHRARSIDRDIRTSRVIIDRGSIETDP